MTKRSKRTRRADQARSSDSAPSRSSENEVSIRWGTEFLVVLLVAVIVCLLVHAPSASVGFMFDDGHQQLAIGYYETGRIGFGSLVLAPAGEHLLPLWRAIYYGYWKVFGLVPRGWHVAGWLVHSLTAAVLFLLLRRFQISRIPAAFGALLWAGAATPAPQDPLFWIFANHYALALLFFLLAMFSISWLQPPRAKFAAVATAVFAILSVATWSVFLALLPILFVQYRLMRRGSNPRPRTKRFWIVLGGLALLLAAIGGLLFLQGPMELSGGVSLDPTKIIPRTAVLMSTALANLTWRETLPTTGDLRGDLAVAVGAAIVVFILAGQRRKEAALPLAIGATYLLLLNAGRGDMSLAALLTQLRYLYFPQFAWCGAIAVAIGGLQRRLPEKWRWTILAGSIVVAELVWTHQYRCVTEAVRRFETQPLGDQSRSLVSAGELLSELSAAAESPSLKLPDCPVYIPPMREVYFPLSAVAAIWFPDGIPDVSIEPPDQLSQKEVDHAVATLQSCSGPLVGLWSHSWSEAWRDLSALKQLSSAAIDVGELVVLSDAPYSKAGMHVRLADLVALGYRGGLAGVVVVPPNRVTFDDRRDLLRLLEQAEQPWADRILELTQATANEHISEEFGLRVSIEGDDWLIFNDSTPGELSLEIHSAADEEVHFQLVGFRTPEPVPAATVAQSRLSAYQQKFGGIAVREYVQLGAFPDDAVMSKFDHDEVDTDGRRRKRTTTEVIRRQDNRGFIVWLSAEPEVHDRYQQKVLEVARAVEFFKNESTPPDE